MRDDLLCPDCGHHLHRPKPGPCGWYDCKCGHAPDAVEALAAALEAAIGHWEDAGAVSRFDSMDGARAIADALAAAAYEREEGAAWNATREMRIEVGPVVISQCRTDPGDMGEPRVFESDGVTYVAVPDFDAQWAAAPPPALDVERCACGHLNATCTRPTLAERAANQQQAER